MKKWGWILITIIVVVSTLVNIKNQFNTLESAKTKNSDLKLKLEQMNILKVNLVKKIEYATSSAFINSQRKTLLGLGTENDYWLDIEDDGTKSEEIIREIHETEKESNLKKWWEMFTD